MIRAADIIEAMRPIGMAGDLRLLPRRELGIEFLERLRCLGLQPGDFLADGGRAVARLECTQLVDLGLDLGHWLFKIEIAAHRALR